MFLVTLLPLMAIVWTTQALTSVSLVTDSGQSIFAFMHLATLILPTIIPLILPFARGYRRGADADGHECGFELTVLNAAGASRMTIIRPILYLGVALSVLSFTVDNFVESPIHAWPCARYSHCACRSAVVDRRAAPADRRWQLCAGRLPAQRRRVAWNLRRRFARSRL